MVYDDDKSKSGLKAFGGILPFIIKFILYTILGLIIFCVFSLIIIFFIQIFLPGGSFFIENYVVDPLSNIGVGTFLKNILVKIPKLATTPGQAELAESYSWKATIDENSKKQDLGVKITSFKVRDAIVYTEKFKGAEATAEFSAATIEPLRIEISCLTEYTNCELANQGNVVQLSSNEKKSFGARCICKQVPLIKETFLIDTSKATDMQKIKIRASYDFTTEAYLTVYLLKKGVLDELTEKGSRGPIRNEFNIFEEMNIDDPTLDKTDKTTEAVYTQGPVRLILKSADSQPYTEEGPFINPGSYYTLDIKIDDELSWTGNVEKIEELELLTTEEIDLHSENFRLLDTEDNFKVYKAEDSLIQELNDICKNKEDSLIEEKCWRQGVITTGVEFSINNAPDELSNTFIRARVKYKFNDEKQDTITFINTEVA